MSIIFVEQPITNYRNLYDSFLIPYFIGDEIKPFEILIELYNLGHYKIITINDDTKPIGAAFLVYSEHFDCALLDYLAVKKEYRNLGYGEKLLDYLKFDYCKNIPIIIETDYIDDNLSFDEIKTRLRRNSFYTRNGAFMISYSVLIWQCHFNIWYLSVNSFSDRDIIKMYDDIYRYMLPNSMYEFNCKIPFNKI